MMAKKTALETAKERGITKETVTAKAKTTTATKGEEKAMTTKIAKKAEVKATTVKATTATKEAPKKGGIQDRPKNNLGHILGTMSDKLDNAILTNKATIESLTKMLMKEHKLAEKPAGYRVKSHLDHLKTAKHCTIDMAKDGILHLHMPKTSKTA